MEIPPSALSALAWKVALTADLGGAPEHALQIITNVVEAAMPPESDGPPVVLGNQDGAGARAWSDEHGQDIAAIVDDARSDLYGDTATTAATIVPWGGVVNRATGRLDRRYVVVFANDDRFIAGLLTLAQLINGDLGAAPGASRLVLGAVHGGLLMVVAAVGLPGVIERVAVRQWISATVWRAQTGRPRWDGPDAIVPQDRLPDGGYPAVVDGLITAFAGAHGATEHHARARLFALSEGIPTAHLTALPEEASAPPEWTQVVHHRGWRLFVTAPVALDLDEC